MNEAIFVFVYKKDNLINVLSLEGAQKQHKEFINQGWKHVETLDAIQYIKYQFEHNEKN